MAVEGLLEELELLSLMTFRTGSFLLENKFATKRICY